MLPNDNTSIIFFFDQTTYSCLFAFLAKVPYIHHIHLVIFNVIVFTPFFLHKKELSMSMTPSAFLSLKKIPTTRLAGRPAKREKMFKQIGLVPPLIIGMSTSKIPIVFKSPAVLEGRQHTG